MDLQETAARISNVGLAVLSELTRLGEQHSCILAARVLTEVLHRKGYSAAYPLTVRAQILNPSFYTWVKEHGFPVDEESQKKCEASGGALIGLGTGPPETMPVGRWAGHVAVVIPNAFADRHALSDITIPQACKSDWGVNLPPMLVRVHDAFVKGEKEFKAEVYGALVIYKAFPEDRSYDGSGPPHDRWTPS